MGIKICQNCKHATLYIPYFTYPWGDPYCDKGHGKCAVDKCCDDFELIGRLSR
jgi:hypothetical protein